LKTCLKLAQFNLFMSRFSLIFLCFFSFLISIFSFFNIIYSYYFDLLSGIDKYVYTLIFSLIFSFIFLFKNKVEEKVTIYENILTVILGYFILPLLLSLPYYVGINNISLIDSYFEAISGFTSTGFTIFENIKHIDETIILWRSTTQWIGGLYFLFSIILLISIFDNNLKKSLTNFLSFDTNETLKQNFKILILYSLLTFFIFIILRFINIRTFDAFNLSMTIISSGGFLPTNEIDTIIKTNLQKFVLSILLLISFYSLYVSYNLINIKKKNLNFFTEDLYLSIYLFFVIIFFFIFFNSENNFFSIFFSITSSVSNIGISLKDTPSSLNFLFVLLVIIGGSFFSTSSGLRFLRLYALFKYSINELLSHAKPKNVYINKFYLSEIEVNKSDLNKYFLSILVFIISLFSVTFLLTISEINVSDAFKLGILTLMNTVNSSSYQLNDFTFYDLNNYLKSVFIIYMIIGRVELLTIVILFKKFLLKD
tara:strand:- start:66 stop:1511 length:1446 start_codon:yes stop_codon:yes gene_type:complete